MKTSLFLIPLLLFSLTSEARVHSTRNPAFDFPAGITAPVLGTNGLYRLGKGETLVELAHRMGIGFQALSAANPEIDPWLPPAGKDVVLPFATILPPGIGSGITINLAEYRLYYVWTEKGKQKVAVYPVGVGIEGWETPEREFRIKAKVLNPSWTAPLSIRQERPDQPAYVPPGPDNPLGAYWLELGDGYGIHGTNRPFAIGRRVSRGCMRLYDDHIRELFQRVRVGTPVRVIYQPIKLGLKEGKLLVEVHHDYMGRLPSPLEEAVIIKNDLGWKGAVDLSALAAALREAKGIPVPVSRP
jgi:L,D-transpeptidase ErfK/SrfK